MKKDKIKKISETIEMGKIFQITRNVYATARSESTSYGFRHLATLYKNGSEIASAKATYYNRTWERYEFESVLNRLKEKAEKNNYLSKYEMQQFNKKIKTWR